MEEEQEHEPEQERPINKLNKNSEAVSAGGDEESDITEEEGEKKDRQQQQ